MHDDDRHGATIAERSRLVGELARNLGELADFGGPALAQADADNLYALALERSRLAEALGRIHERELQADDRHGGAVEAGEVDAALSWAAEHAPGHVEALGNMTGAEVLPAVEAIKRERVLAAHPGPTWRFYCGDDDRSTGWDSHGWVLQYVAEGNGDTAEEAWADVVRSQVVPDGFLLPETLVGIQAGDQVTFTATDET